MGLIIGVLRPVLQLWLRSQLAAVETLHVKLEGSDGEFLQGRIPAVAVRATGVVYQGLYLGRAALAAEGILLQWRPSVQLQAPLIAQLQIGLTDRDLTASLTSPLVQSGLTDLLARALSIEPAAIATMTWETARFEAGRVILSGPNARLEFGLSVEGAPGGNDLVLAPVCLHWRDRAWETPATAFDLGDAAMESLEIVGDRLQLQGMLTIRPEAANTGAAEASQRHPSVDSEVPKSG